MTAHDMLVERLVRAGKAAGEDALARVAYEMARRCWSLAEETQARHIRWIEDPRPVAESLDKFDALEARTGIEVDRSSLPLTDPAAEAALSCARECLEVGTRIEGASPRVQLLRAQCARHSGDVDECIDRLEIAVRGPLTRDWFLTMQEELISVLTDRGDYDRADHIGQSLLRRGHHRPIVAFNLLIGLGWTEQRSRFDAMATQLEHALKGAPDAGFWEQVVKDESDWLAHRFGMDPVDIVRHALPPEMRRAES